MKIKEVVANRCCYGNETEEEIKDMYNGNGCPALFNMGSEKYKKEPDCIGNCVKCYEQDMKEIQ